MSQLEILGAHPRGGGGRGGGGGEWSGGSGGLYLTIITRARGGAGRGWDDGLELMESPLPP